MNIELWDIERVKPYPNNAPHSDYAVEVVAASIREFGFRQLTVVDAEGVIGVGHTRSKAALKLGLKKLPVHVATDLTPEQIKAYRRIADNKGAEVSDWNYDLLPIELAGLKKANYDLSLLSFDSDELAKLVNPTSRAAENEENLLESVYAVLLKCKGAIEQKALLQELERYGFDRYGLDTRAIVVDMAKQPAEAKLPEPPLAAGKVEITRETKITRTPRAMQLEGTFDIPPTKQAEHKWRFRFEHDRP